MNDILKTDVTAFAPELLGVTDAVWFDLLKYVNLMNLTECDDPVTVRMARIFLAAHMATMNKRAASASAGPVTGESAGNVRRSYGLVSTGSDSGSYSQTRYGILYQDVLKRSQCAGPGVI